MNLPYCRPSIDSNDVAGVVNALEHHWLTTGPKVREFEDAFAAKSGVKYAIAVNSCTAALHLGIVAMGVGPGDEVIMPSLSFVAAAESTRQIGAIPVFCDVEPDSLSTSVETIAPHVTKRTKLIIPMHYGGNPVNIAPIVAFAKERNIRVFEDAAHAAGTLDDGVWAGAVSDAAAYSFYATKNLATGEGGMFLTNEEHLMERVRVMSLHGMDRDAWKRYSAGGNWRYDVKRVGYKYNMPDIAAALGLSQLAKLDAMQTRRNEIAARYIAGLKDLPGIQPIVPELRANDRHAWCMFVIAVDENTAGIQRDALIDALNANGIGTSVHYIPSHLFSAYTDYANDKLATTDAMWKKIISLPLYPSMSNDDVDGVVETLEQLLMQAKRSEVA